jgi:Ca2+-transporting ATPase
MTEHGLMTAPETGPGGLSSAEAVARLASTGPNEIPAARRRSWARRLGVHLIEPMSALLIIAASVEGLALGERLEAAAILAIVALNAVIGTVQEGRAQRALDALRSMEPRYATVIRDGVRARIPLREVVSGDLVALAAGDRVPADVDLVTANGLEIDESILTGESLSVDKRADVDDDSARAFAGTIVTSGEGLGTASATGASSSLGRIAAELGEDPAPTPLQRQLGRLSRTLGVAAVVVAAGVFVLTLVRFGVGEDQLREAFLSAVALAVAAVPEGLPAVVTIVLALGVRAMAERGAIVRRMPAVETLGSADVILTDKTGTLTENRMHADRFVVPGAPDGTASIPASLREAIVLGSDATLDPATGDPLEVAMLEAIGPDDVRHIRSMTRRIASIPFDARTRRTITVSDRGSSTLAVVKGAPEVVLRSSLDAWGGPEHLPLDRDAVLSDAEALASTGSRVIAFGVKEDDDDHVDVPEEGFSFLGLVGLRDPVRAEAASAIADAASAGIRVVMVTGDHSGTAASVGRDVGLVGPDDRIVDGIDPGAQASVGADDVRVYARVLPTDKLDIVRAYQGRGATVAVTGDGVNDAPALRQADIGVAMGRTGSDVAREAADMVITDDDLGTIVHAIREGRRIFGNIRKVIDYLVAGNVSEVAVVIGALLFAPAGGVPLTPLQLLWINLLTDGLPAVALGTGPAADRTPDAIASSSLLSWSRMRVLAARAALIASVSLATLFVARFTFDASWEAARTAMFTVLVMSHLLYAFVVQLDRPERIPAPARSLWRARGLLVAVGLGVALQLLVVVVPLAGTVLETSTLPPTGWLLCAAASAIPPLAMWAADSIRHRSAPTPRAA